MISSAPSTSAVPSRPEACEHFHEATSRYDRDARLLKLLLVCPVCRIENVVETLAYEPRYIPSVIPGRERSGHVRATAADALPLAA